MAPAVAASSSVASARPSLEALGDVRLALVVDARHLLVAVGDDAHLRRGLAVWIGEHGRRADAAAGQLLAEPGRRSVVADHADERDPSPERVRVAGHVGGAAHAVLVAIELHDRHGRLWRDAPNPPHDELIQHQIAHDHERHPLEAVQQIGHASG